MFQALMAIANETLFGIPLWLLAITTTATAGAVAAIALKVMRLIDKKSAEKREEQVLEIPSNIEL